MKLIIDIPEAAYKLLQSDEGVDWLGAEHILHAVANGVPLPKGHGRIIDESQIRSVTICCDEERIDGWRLQHEYVDSTDAPTIVEADNAECEGKA